MFTPVQRYSRSQPTAVRSVTNGQRLDLRAAQPADVKCGGHDSESKLQSQRASLLANCVRAFREGKGQWLTSYTSLIVSDPHGSATMVCPLLLPIVIKSYPVPVRNLLIRILGLAMAFMLSGCAQADLPPFDISKWRQISPEKKRQYDVVFFNEIETWNLNSNRYSPDRSHIERRAEFEKMSTDGYFPAYAAIRLAGIWPAQERDDPEALEMLLKEAERGDTSAMCAVLVTPQKRELWGERNYREISRKLMVAASAQGHGACMGYYGGALLLGNIPEIPQNRKAAIPLLLESAKQGYYVAAFRLFQVRRAKIFTNEFDFTNREELERALCWGRLAEQHTNWAGFHHFLGTLRDYARANNRPDLMEQSYRLDHSRVPITEKAVKPEDCIQLEKGE
jgi:hypothetical protein